MTDEQAFCDGPGIDPGTECGRPLAGHGRGKCAGHLKQLQRHGECTPIAEKVSAKENLINLYSRLAEADGDDDYEAAERAFFAQVKVMARNALTDDDVGELIRKTISVGTRRKMAAAKARGVHVGRPARADHREAARLAAMPKVDLVALLLKVSRATAYRLLKRTPSATGPRSAGSST